MQIISIDPYMKLVNETMSDVELMNLQRTAQVMGYRGPDQPYVRQTPRIGRNEMCPCGSGKKYKHCCNK